MKFKEFDIKIVVRVIDRFIGTRDECCDFCEREGRIVFYEIYILKADYSFYICSECLKKIKAENK